MAENIFQKNPAIMTAKRDKDIITKTLDKLDDPEALRKKRELKKCVEEKRKQKSANKVDYSKPPSERAEIKKTVFSANCLGKGAIFSSGA